MMLTSMGLHAKKAARIVSLKSAKEKNNLLRDIGEYLWENRMSILEANSRDVAKAKTDGLSVALIDRLLLDEIRLRSIVNDIEKVIDLEDPIGEVFDQKDLENGLKVHKLRVPIGVIGVIFESRPNVTVDIAVLALKTGNCVILRGGRETINTNQVIVSLIQQCLFESNFPAEAVQFIDNPDRKVLLAMLKLHQYIDMLIPRGSESLHHFCRENSQIPVITGGIGICHLFIDESADLGSSLNVIRNAKVQRPSVCNALDTILVHRKISNTFIPRVVEKLQNDSVSFRISEEDLSNIAEIDQTNIVVASENDFRTEWLSLVLGIKIVDDVNQAIEHIMNHSTGHSDGILSEDNNNTDLFIKSIDSAVVYANASTRFTDGSQLGLGAEVAISTQRLHARGPMALKELTTYKWIVKGNYHIRP